MPKTTKVYYCIVCKKDFVTDSHFFITHKVKPIIKQELLFSQPEVEDKVRLLKYKVYDLYHKIGKTNVFSASNDVVCDLCEEFINQAINDVFSQSSPEKK